MPINVVTRFGRRIYEIYLLAVLLIFVIIRLAGSNTASRLLGHH